MKHIANLALLIPLSLLIVSAAFAVGTFWNQQHHMRFWDKYRLDGERNYIDLEYEAAEKNLLRAVREAESFGAKDVRLADTLKRLAVIYLIEEKWPDSEDSYLHSLRILDHVDESGRPDDVWVLIGQCSFGLGTIYEHEKNLQKAETFYRKAIAAFQKVKPDESAPKIDVTSDYYSEEFAGSLLGLANVYRDTGRMRDAALRYKETLAISSQTPVLMNVESQANEEIKTLIAMSKGKTVKRETRSDPVLEKYRKAARKSFLKRNYRESEKQFKLALKRSQEMDDDLEIAASLQDLAQVYAQLSHFNTAERLYEKAFPLLRDRYPEKADDALVSIIKIYNQDGDYEGLEKQIRKQLAFRLDKFGADDVRTAESLYQLGFVIRHLHRHFEAEPFFKRSVDSYQRILGKDHPSTRQAVREWLITQQNIAEKLLHAGEYQKAIPLLKKTVALQEKVLSRKDDRTIGNLRSLATCYTLLGQYDYAADIYSQLIEVNEEHFGKSDRALIPDIGGLGEVYYKQGKLDEAERLLRRGLDITDRWLERANAMQRNELLRDRDIGSPYQMMATLSNILNRTGRQAESGKWQARLKETAAVK